MKKIYLFIIAFNILTNVVAQSPQGFSYQAIIRDVNNKLITGQSVGILVSILQGSESGSIIYSETHITSTNLNGLVTFEIGNGATSDNFSSINWANGPYYIKVETDPTGGTNYTIISTSQLLSVPYALFAGNTSNNFSGKYTSLTDTPLLAKVARTGNYSDLLNQPILFNGQYTSLSGIPTFAKVATSGSFTDLINVPAELNGKYTSLTDTPILAKVARSGNYSDLLNQPILFNGQYSSLTGAPTFAKVATTDSYNDLINKPFISDTIAALAVLLTGNQYIAGNKTFGSDLLVNGITVGRGGGSVSTNTSAGNGAMAGNTTGSGNTVMGDNSLTSNSTGSSNTSIGSNAGNLAQGSNNLFVGSNAGAYETGSDAFYVNVYNQGNTTNDKTNSLLYGQFNATPSNQQLTVNGVLNATYGINLPSGQTYSINGVPISTGLSNPMTSVGDLIYGGTSGLPNKLAIGSSNQVLTVISGVPTWASLTGSEVFPGAGIPNSSGSSWETSYSTTGTGSVLALSNSPAFSGIVTGITSTMVGAEPALGNPTTSGYILSSSANGSRSWITSYIVGRDATFNYCMFGADRSLAFQNVTSAMYNLGIGGDGMFQFVTSAEYNAGFGDGVLYELTTGHGNVALGTFSGEQLTSGGYNTVVGMEALAKDILGSGNVTLGYFSGHYELGSNAFYVDNTDWGSLTSERAGALLYGSFNTTPSAQFLITNSLFTATYGMNVPSGQTYDVGGVPLAASNVGAEPALGNPLVSGYVLSSTNTGIRSWVPAGSGSMIYPGAGIPSSSGTEWNTSFTTSGTGSIVALTNGPTFTGTINGVSANFSGTVEASSFSQGLTSNTTASGGTLTLTATSTFYQVFTGSYSETIVLPAASTMVEGQSFYIVNGNAIGASGASTNLTVNSSGGNVVQYVGAGQAVLVTCVLNSGTTAASWMVSPNYIVADDAHSNYLIFGLNRQEAFRDRTTGINNLSIGGDGVYNVLTSGSYNTSVGDQALQNLISGNYNTATGMYALADDETGSNNTAIGYQALGNARGTGNVAIGYFAGGNIHADNNLFFVNNYNTGSSALDSTNSLLFGIFNTSPSAQKLVANAAFSATYGMNVPSGQTYSIGGVALGSAAMATGRTETSGLYNTAFGNNSLSTGVTGIKNVAVGNGALNGLTTGSFNTAIGDSANVSASGITNATAIGHGAIVNSNNSIVIGNGNVTSIGGYAAWSNYSDRRLKENIVENNKLGLNFISQLHTVSYNYIADAGKHRRDGLIAQDVEKTLNELGLQFSGLVIADDKDKTMSLSYGDFVIPLINAVQEQQKTIEKQQFINEKIANENNALKQKISDLQSQIDDINKKLEAILQH